MEALEVDYPAEEKRVHGALKRYAELRQAGTQDHAEIVRHRLRDADPQEAALLQPSGVPPDPGTARGSLRNARSGSAVSKPTRGVLQRQIDRMEEDYSVDDEADEATHEALEAASLLFREPSPEELSLLKEMKSWAERATSQLERQDQGADPLARRAHPARREVVR